MVQLNPVGYPVSLHRTGEIPTSPGAVVTRLGEDWYGSRPLAQYLQGSRPQT